jgi:hypothetical protein
VTQRLAAIQARRAQLLERAARERGDLARTLQSWAQPLDFVDRCIEAARYVIARPPLLAGAALVLALLQPRRTFRWARRGFALWQGYRWLNRKIAL